MIDGQKIIAEVCDIARKSGDFIRSQTLSIVPANIEVKGLHDFVTYVDKTSEKRIVERLLHLIPDAGFITEEKTVQTGMKEYTWIIDPLDGTTNFIHGLHPFAVSIALYHKTEGVLGVVYEVGSDECFYATSESPAFLNGNEIHVSGRKTVSDSLIATGFPYYDYGRLEAFQKTLSWFFEHSHGVRRLGSAATDLAYVAAGRFEAFYEYGLQPWDVAGGSVIVRQAGGKIVDFKGGDEFLFGRELIATNAEIHDEFVKKIQSFMNC